MPSTQRFIPIDTIANDLVYLNNGSVGLVITTSAVNFALLFETEQYGIIDSFAGLLNSLSFPIQIVIRSKSLDVSSYLATLDAAMKKQTNYLLSTMTKKYKLYVESLIKDNNVLDKKFYICITVSMLELGIISKNSENRTKKALTVLYPRRDHIIRQLGRIGLKSKQLSSVELIQLLYDIYNPSYLNSIHETVPVGQIITNSHSKVSPIKNTETLDRENNLGSVINTEPESPNVDWIHQDNSLQKQATDNPNLDVTIPTQNIQMDDQSSHANNIPLIKNITTPFVVEELIDEVWPKKSE